VKFESPEYAAVIECEPTDRDVGVNVACPFVSGTDASVVDPSLNVTVPIGVPLPDVGVTAAVRVTDEARIDGFADEATVVVVAGWPMPVPISAKVAGTTLNPFVMPSVPTLLPTALGVKATLAMQLALTAKGEEDVQLSVSEKSPLALTPSILSGPVPVFVTVIWCAELVIPIFWLAKLSDTGLTVITGGGTVTGTVVWTFWPFSAYVAVIAVLPALPPVIIPLGSTVATAVFADEYVT